VTRYLTVEDVLHINHREVSSVLRDRHLLESAVGEPQQVFDGQELYPTLDDKAAVLLRSLARNHAFIDGNKRTAWLATAVFYRLNGWWLHMPAQDAVPFVVDVATGVTDDLGEIAARLQDCTRPRP
jgi:death on curing protein